MAAIYYHPESYPPTLNAIQELSGIMDNITIVYRPHLPDSWSYETNVALVPSDKQMSAREQESASTIKKIKLFFAFTRDLYRVCRSDKPDIILIYDSLALLAYSILRPLIFYPHKLWYHNHDISETNGQRMFSLGWFAARVEKIIFSRIDIFTLPSEERKKYFDMSVFKGRYFFIPNFPSKYFYASFYNHAERSHDEIKLIFQGRIGPGHGIEEIIPMLGKKIKGRKIKLILKGFADPSYKDVINQLLNTNQINAKYLEWVPYGPYKEVALVSSACHIGIAIFNKLDVMNQTLGTASNKIYEYAAVGLPVIYLRDSAVAKFLSQYDWAFPVVLEKDSLENAISNIMENYDQLSSAAYLSFSDKLNYEYNFRKLAEFLTTLKNYSAIPIDKIQNEKLTENNATRK